MTCTTAPPEVSDATSTDVHATSNENLTYVALRQRTQMECAHGYRVAYIFCLYHCRCYSKAPLCCHKG